MGFHNLVKQQEEEERGRRKGKYTYTHTQKTSIHTSAHTNSHTYFFYFIFDCFRNKLPLIVNRATAEQYAIIISHGLFTFSAVLGPVGQNKHAETVDIHLWGPGPVSSAASELTKPLSHMKCKTGSLQGLAGCRLGRVSIHTCASVRPSIAASCFRSGLVTYF